MRHKARLDKLEKGIEAFNSIRGPLDDEQRIELIRDLFSVDLRDDSDGSVARRQALISALLDKTQERQNYTRAEHRRSIQCLLAAAQHELEVRQNGMES